MWVMGTGRGGEGLRVEGVGMGDEQAGIVRSIFACRALLDLFFPLSLACAVQPDCSHRPAYTAAWMISAVTLSEDLWR